MERKPQFVPEGVRHATINGHRFHLRLTDPTEDNFLWIDGQSPPLVLDQVAADFVAFIIQAMWKFQQGEGDESDRVREFVVEEMFKKYGYKVGAFEGKVSKTRIKADLDRIFGTLMGIAEGTCPVEAGLAMKEIKPSEWAAPARMDLAVTYKCNLNCRHCYLPIDGSKKMNELSFKGWLRVYETLWRIGVPQIVFTGGEPTLRGDLVGLVSEAEEFVTGLVTNGTRLAELAEPLKKASLDYAQVTLESLQPEIHNQMVGASDAFGKTVEGIKKALSLGINVVTNTTLTRENAFVFPELLQFGKEIGLKSMSANTLICSGRGLAAKKENGLSVEELKGVMEKAVKTAEELGINFQWYSPTCYLHFNPVELGLGAKSCSAAAHNMTIQPDGTVLPCQSWPESVGNILWTPWKEIWNHPICLKLREHSFAREKEECLECVHNQVCGGGCPLETK